MYLCHLLSHDSHMAGKGEGARRSYAIQHLQAMFVDFTQRWDSWCCHTQSRIISNLIICFIVVCFLSAGGHCHFQELLLPPPSWLISLRLFSFTEWLTASARIIHFFLNKRGNRSSDDYFFILDLPVCQNFMTHSFKEAKIGYCQELGPHHS